MQNRKKILVALIVLVLLVAFALFWHSRIPREMNADIKSSNGAHYSLELPKDFVDAHFNDTLPEMSLQYESADDDLHILVIDESKAKIISFGLDYDLDTYMKIATRTLDKDGIYVNKPLTINGNKALQTEIRLTSNGIKKVYKLTCIETQKFFYQVLTWTAESEFEPNKDDMEKMINSFRENIQ
ncbi:MAG: hypothetical protein M3R17_03535 [Bacteroidota bacterium]|nr:hypothetical protein [Bacteroidota bacterium]